MNPTRSIAVALALVSATFLSGCQTSGAGKTAENRIRLNSGAYQSENSAVSGDIRSILMAGGLDAANPSAPTGDTSKSELAKPAAVASDTKAIVAALSDSNSAVPALPPTVKLAASPEPSVETTSRTSAALAMVEPPKQKPAPQKKIILDTKVEMDASPVIELASINMSRSDGDDAFDPLPAPEEKKPVLSALPVAKPSKGDRQPATRATESANNKTSRVRRF